MKNIWKVLLAVVLTCSLAAVAFASPGGEGDPLITLGYLTNIFQPQILKQVQEDAEAEKQDFQDALNLLIDQRLNGTAPDPSASPAPDPSASPEPSPSPSPAPSPEPTPAPSPDPGTTPAPDPSADPAEVPVFSVVTLSQGQILTGDVGCEVMLRVGSATCVADSNPGLVDETDGTLLNNGSSLVTNHLYMVTISTRSVQAASATVKVLVRGPYTVA